MRSKLIYWLVYSGMWIVAGLPFRFLYGVSNLCYYLVYYILRYRRGVVRRNIANSFPDMAFAQRLEVEKKFYRYLCDYFFEDIKLMRISSDELQQRMTYENVDLFLEMIEKYGGIILVIPHYANYEWIIGMGAVLNEGDVPVQVYKPLKNQYLDHLFRFLRSRFGGHNVPKHQTARELIKLKRDGKRMVVGLITDQWPAADEKYWTQFLNQETAFLTGADRIAKMMRFPVFYCDLKKEKRGYCKVYFDLMAETPSQLNDNEITEMFARRLEQTIMDEPAYWLWSHKRWKASRADSESLKK